MNIRINYYLALTMVLNAGSALAMIKPEDDPRNPRRPRPAVLKPMAKPAALLKPTAKPAPAIRNITKTCEICTDQKPAIDFRTLSCGHNGACVACLKHIADNAIAQKRTTTLKCPNAQCNRIIEERDLNKIVYDKSKHDEIADIQLQEWIRQQPNAKQCPTANCGYAFLNEDSVAGNTQCPNCETQYCNQCLHAHANTVTCHNAELARNQNNAAERATQQWKAQNTKACPHCNTAIEKNEGCLHMTCTSCRYEFCWNCLGVWRTHNEGYYRCSNQVNTPQQAQQQAATHQRMPVYQPAPLNLQPIYQPAPARQPAYQPAPAWQNNGQRQVFTTLTLNLNYNNRPDANRIIRHFEQYNIHAHVYNGAITLSGSVDNETMMNAYNTAIRLGIM